MSNGDPQRPLPNVGADFIRGSVRLMVPLASLAVLAVLLYSAQGRDVLRALISASTHITTGYAIDGILFLMAGSTALSLSVWYSSRWLLTADMKGLPLDRTGFGQTWLPRLMGFAAPLMIGVGLLGLKHAPLETEESDRIAAQNWAFGFFALAAALLVFYVVRRKLIAWWLGIPVEDRIRKIGVDDSMPKPTLIVVVWSIALSVALGLLFFWFPITLPRAIGAAAIGALALATINLFGSFVLTYVPLRYGLPPMSLWVILVGGLLVARCNDNHVVEPVRGAEARHEAPIEGLDLILQKLEKLAADGETDGRMLLVASEGGGIRAAYWTAAVLDELLERDPRLKDRIGLLSGVSGGSLGVAAWVVSHKRDYCPESHGTPATAVGIETEDLRPDARRDLAADFVAPAVAAMFYGDLVQRFLPVAIGALDRSRAIEGAWQRAFQHLPGQPFEDTLAALYRDCPDLPQLVLNATRVETGERVALTLVPVKLPVKNARSRRVFINTFDGMQKGSTAVDQSLAGLVHHSARFPLVSPAGTVRIQDPPKDTPSSFRLVDGGYFDNSGVASAFDVFVAVQRKVSEEGPFKGLPFHPLLLVIRNTKEPLDHQTAHAASPSSLFPETGSIALALANVRSSHAVTARGDAKRLFEEDLIDLAVREESAEAPLGWALSSAARRSLDFEAEAVADKAVKRIHERIGTPSKAPASEVGK